MNISAKQKIAILDLFKMAVAEKNVEYNEETAKELLKYGYVCDKNVDMKIVLQWTEDNKFNPNTTFYKTFADVTSATRFELFMDQIIHYFTSYTLNMDEPFIVNDTPVDLKAMNVKFVKSISFEEAVERCRNMLYSGVALKQDTIEKILDVIGDNIEIDNVKNREAQAIIAVNKGVYPTNADAALRCFIFQVTGNTLLIKDDKTINKLKISDVIIPDFLLERFSQIFLRYKPLFLALKKNNRYKINKMRRMAVKNNKPFETPFWNHIIDILYNYDGDEDTIFNIINKRIDELTTYKMISLYNLINIKLNADKTHDMYVIRNGKMFVKEKKSNDISSKTVSRLISLKNSLIGRIVVKVKENVGTDVVELPLNINLVCPTSEKSFMGEIPLYSWIDMDFEDAVIGINWREENGARDLDLSYIDRSGMKIGWNAHYYNDEKSFVYSGDMTSAKPEATELLYKHKNEKALGTVRVNPYAFVGELVRAIETKCSATYKVFFAKEEIDTKSENFCNYMVHPDNIIYSYEDTIEGEKMLGTFVENKFIFANLQTSTRRVSDGENINSAIIDIFAEKQQYYLTIDKVLKAANVNFSYSKEKILSKDDILKLFQ
jgi:hypothetical protein